MEKNKRMFKEQGEKRQEDKKLKLYTCMSMRVLYMCVSLTVRTGLVGHDGQEAVVTSENVTEEKNGLQGRRGAIPQDTGALRMRRSPVCPNSQSLSFPLSWQVISS